MRAGWATLFVAVLVGIHAAVAGADGRLPAAALERFGSSADTLFSRPLSRLSAVFFHRSMAHLGYNALVALAVVPVAVRAGGVRVLPLAFALAVLVSACVDGLVAFAGARGLTDPTSLGVGASVMIFALAGMAVSRLAQPLRVASAYVAYEVLVAATGAVGPLVPIFHVGGFLAGWASARWMRFEGA